MSRTRLFRRLATAVVVPLLALTAGSTTPLALGSVPGPVDAPRAAGSDRGVWRVTQIDRATWRVSWRSPVRLPVTSDRPVIVDGRGELGAPTVAADGRTVRVTARSTARPDPDSLDVLLSGDRLDVRGRDLTARSAVRAQPLPRLHRRILDEDPGAAGPYPTVTSDYDLTGLPLPGMPEPVEMVGHVVEPDLAADTGPRPLVVFLHGRHSFCYDPATGENGWEWPCRAPFQEIPSHLGYAYIQELLASQGFATVSVRVNGINAQDWALDDGGAGARAAVVQAHLDHWAALADAHRVDLSRVVLVGHSRGGEGVARASLRIPLDAPYRIAGQVLLAPTDFATQTSAYVPTVTVLPYCDGDVIDLQGQRFTDTARDLTSDDTSLKSSVMVMGANHNFFNTEWTPGIAQAPAWDDWWGPEDAACGTATPDRLTADEQRAVGQAWVAGAVRLFTEDAEEFVPMYDGSAATVASAGDAVVLSHALGGQRALRRPGIDTGLTVPAGAQTQLCVGATEPGGRYRLCGRTAPWFGSTPHWPGSYERVPLRREFEMAWTAAGQTGGMVFDDPLDLSEDRRLELRTIVDPRFGDVRLRVRLTDATGAQAVLVPADDGLLPALLRGPGLAKRWAQPLLVDPSSATGVDLTRVTRVDLVGDSDDGRVWVLDLASAGTALAPVPDRRLAVVSLGEQVVDEGDGPGPGTARVPYTIAGDLPRRARFVVFVGADRTVLDRGRMTVDLAPGQTEGTIPINYQADAQDDLPRLDTVIAAWAGSEVMTDDYLGSLVVRDDDPSPPMSVTRVRGTVREGMTATWRVRLAEPVGYDLYVEGTVVRGPTAATPVLGADVPRAWLRAHAGSADADRPLHRLGVFVSGRIRAGGRLVDLTVPIRRDGRAEGREGVALQVGLRGRSVTRTVFVAPSR